MRLIEEWRRSWRWASVRLALAAGAISGWAASDPAGFAQAVALLPTWARPLVGLLVAMTAIGARITTRGAKDA
ncbi:hypothetical protein [Novosphingobium colocasiae]|uniref:DUF7940 domain-containing protein n=1 Tax=Novosphingobium colocasiae TaxID=1256513 RepID=UPI0035B130E8